MPNIFQEYRKRSQEIFDKCIDLPPREAIEIIERELAPLQEGIYNMLFKIRDLAISYRSDPSCEKGKEASLILLKYFEDSMEIERESEKGTKKLISDLERFAEEEDFNSDPKS